MPYFGQVKENVPFQEILNAGLILLVESSYDYDTERGAYLINDMVFSFNHSTFAKNVRVHIVTPQKYMTDYINNYPVREWPFYGFSGETDW